MSKTIRSDSSMEAMWRDAILRFNERTKMNVNMKPPKTLDDCIGEMEKTQLSAEYQERTGKEKLENYGINILRCLKLLGGVAAQGAEMVFGAPSSICFNALYLLLDAPEQLKSFREAIDGLFDKLGPSLSVFRIYEKIEQFNDIEPELKQAIHAVMITFVDICALAIELRDSGKWRKLKSRTRLLLLHDDSGIGTEIEKFERLTQAHHSVQSTQTLKVLLETRSDLTVFLEKESERSQQIATDVASLKAADDKRSSEEIRRKHMENIKKKLGIEDSFYKSFKEMCDKPRKDCVPNTAVWLMDDSKFQSWAERDNKESEPLFVVTGAPNTGKSVVLSTAVHHLRSVYESPARNSPRTLVAAYFFTPTKDDQDKRPIATALKCIAIQLADQDSAYAKSLSQSCDGKSENSSFFRDANCEELWDFLRIGSPKGNVTHYLVFDGLGSMADESSDKREQKEQLVSILCKSVQSSVRVLLSVRQDTLQTEDRPPHSNIEVEQHSEPDIQKYIGHFLKSNDLLQDPDDEALRTKILETLSKQVRGNFNKVKAALENIREVVASDGLETDIDKTLNESNMTEKEISQITVAQLESRLTGEEIDELNELLVWVICGRERFSIDQLNAALILRSQRRGTLRLRKKLEIKYANILIVTVGGFVGVQDNMKDLLTKGRTKPRNTDDTSTFSATITITKGDVRSVQSFLWSLSQKFDSLAHDTFGFQQILDQKRMKNNIQVNEVDGNFTIVRRTFHFLASEPNKESQALGNYLLKYLPRHLEQITQKATGYEELTPSQKREVGEGLFALFVSGEVIERHWYSCQLLDWYDKPEDVEIFRRWLDDPSTTGHLGWLDREWLKEVKEDSNPNQAILGKIMKKVATHWLCDRKWNAVKAFKWLKGFRQMPPPRKEERSPSSHGLNDSSPPADPPPGPVLVADVLTWCKEMLSINTDEDRVLMYERLGETYFGENEFAKAIEAYNHAIGLTEPGWKSLEGLARALAGDGQHEKACETMERSLKLLNDEDTPDKQALITVNYGRLAEWFLALEQPRRAIEYTKRAIEVTPKAHKPNFELLRIYLFNDLIEDAVAFLGDMVKAEVTQDEASLFGQVISDIANDSDLEGFFGRLFEAVSGNTETLLSALHEMDREIDRARKEDNMIYLAQLLLYNGIAVYRWGPEEATRAERAIRCWEQCINIDISSWNWNYPNIAASSWLCGHYFNQALALSQPTPQDLDAYFQKLKHLVEKESSSVVTGSKMYLACYYSRISKDVPNAQKILQRGIESAFDMLSDDVDDNDGWGYHELGDALMHCGDDLNALRAYTLPVPERAEHSLSWVLDFDTEPERSLSNELIVAMEKYHLGSDVKVQIDFILKRIESALSNTDAHEDDGKSSASDQVVEGTSQESLIPIDDNIGATSKRITEGNPNQAIEGSDNAIEKTETDEESNKIEMKTAYEKIKLKVDGLAAVFNSSIHRYCDVCYKKWNLENSLNICKYCDSTDFCDDCLGKLKAGTLKLRSIATQCNKSHDWLRLAKWDKETYLRALRKEVCVGGQIDSEGRFTGGKMVPAAEWLDRVKKQWGIIEKQKPEQASPEDEEATGEKTEPK
ncbi:hypothetical protein F4677DRAFT_447150 [Hypoxylon crocopeplum]|nr:hypothetical protein F4677DRAFT_447150 [Hypoxylon crocopeplum]